MIFKKTAEQKKNTTATFRIEGMHCTSCAMNIDGALEDTDGVVSASTNYAKSLTTVEYDSEKITPAKLQEVIGETGYQASLAQ